MLNLIIVVLSGLVPSGSAVILICSYSVSPGEYIDSIKWYLNTSEIYRIVPGLNRDRSDQIYSIKPGLNILFLGCLPSPQEGPLSPSPSQEY